MRQYLKFIPLLFFIQTGLAQYTDVINSKRPGFSDSPYSIGTGVYQVESGLYYKKIGNFLFWDYTTDPATGYRYNSKSFGTDITLRNGLFFERLEFDLDLAFQQEKRNYTSPDEYSENAFGLNKFTIGAKYLVYMPKYTDKSKEIRSWKARHSFDYKRLIPAVGVYAGFNTNLLDALHKNPEGVSARFGIFTQNDISERWIILMNFIIDQVFTNYMESSFILTTTYALTPKFSVFGEGELFFRTQEGVPNDIQFGAGGAYLINKNMQVDLAGRMILDERGDNTILFNTGFSWRIDHHHDKIIIKETKNNNIGLPKEEKSFFEKITFGLFTGKKHSNKTKSPAKVKSVKAKHRNITPPVNKKAQKAKKKRNKQLIKQQKRKEKAEKKYYKKKKKAEDKN